MTGDIVIKFIIPKECKNEDQCSEDMQQAFLTCEQHSGSGLKAEWVHETLFKKYEGLTKKDIFVLSEFSGEIYERLHATKCLLLGPRCLSCCLTEGSPIPTGNEPVYTIAMRGLVVTASGLTKEKKENIKRKVFWMGGFYSTVLSDDATHLVSDTVMSDKYIKSVEKGIPVMSEIWVEAVWLASLTQNVNGSSPVFNIHLLPPFANLQVTTSGIARREKQIITKLINENGGMFSGAFQSETTHVVVVNKEGIGSEKYKAALEYGKAVVLPKWVKDSAERRVALPFGDYKVIGASTSSPLSETRLPDMSLNFSRITNLRPVSNFVDETTSSNMSTMSVKGKTNFDTKRSDSSNIDKDVLAAFEGLDMSVIKKAGPIFDGFCIWVCGLEGICRDRGVACVSRCGGVRYEAAHPRVTHAVAGNLQSATLISKELPNVPILSPVWLVKSVEAGRPLDETEFLIDPRPSTPAKSSSRKQQMESASPMSKRNLQLLRREVLDLPPPTPEVEEPRDDLVNHYLSQNLLEPLKEKTPERAMPVEEDKKIQEDPDITEDPTEEIEQIFRGVKIEVQGLDEEAITEIGAEVAAAGGVLSAAGAGGTHVLVPLDFDPQELITKHAEPITVFWVKDCLCQQELVPIEYYHRPVKVSWGDDSGPLRGVVASLSTYSGIERAFLDELAKLLGATTQLRFCRRNTPNAQASTHLICPSAVGDKYLGAVKWNLPAVKATWLLECAEKGIRVSEKDHLIGETSVPSPPVIQEEEQAERQTNNETDKENEMLPPAVTNVPRRGSISIKGENTPKAKVNNEGEGEMSPASRYIAMARQGLLGSDSQETPKRVNQLKENAHQDNESIRTPPLDEALSTPNLSCLSPTTRRRLQAVKRGEMPSDPIRTPVDPFQKNVDTPDSCFGAALRPGSGRLSPDARKRLWKFVNDLPSKQPEPIRDNHTPLSEIRNRFLAQFNGGDSTTPPSEHVTAPRKLHLQEPSDTPPAKMAKHSAEQSAGAINMTDDTDDDAKEKSDSSASSAKSALPPAVDVQLQRLNAALTNRLSSQRSRRMTRESISVPPQPETEPGPESQPNTIGWDDTTPAQHQAVQTERILKRFMLSSNVDNREEIIEMILHLGGSICEGAELDPDATHLLCAAPGRSEKMLGSIAAGKWVLHPAYVARSRAANRFLPEEEYEWGNPLATCLPPLSGNERVLAGAAYRWRSAKAQGRHGPFKGMVALLHVPQPRKRLLARLVIAGDGEAPDLEPPYKDENVTVCFLDAKRYPLSSADAAWLTSKRIPVCAPVLLSSFLTEDPPPRPQQHCLPEFKLIN